MMKSGCFRVTVFAYRRHCDERVDVHAYTSVISHTTGQLVGVCRGKETRGVFYWAAFVCRWLHALSRVSFAYDVVAVHQNWFTERKPYMVVSPERNRIEAIVSTQKHVLLVDYWKHWELMDDVRLYAKHEGQKK